MDGTNSFLTINFHNVWDMRHLNYIIHICALICSLLAYNSKISQQQKDKRLGERKEALRALLENERLQLEVTKCVF